MVQNPLQGSHQNAADVKSINAEWLQVQPQKYGAVAGDILILALRQATLSIFSVQAGQHNAAEVKYITAVRAEVQTKNGIMFCGVVTFWSNSGGYATMCRSPSYIIQIQSASRPEQSR